MRKLDLKPIMLSMNPRMRRQVLDCGDGVCEVTALATLTAPKLADAETIPTQSGNSADSVAALQKLAHQPMPRQFMAPMRVQSWRSKLPKRWLPGAVVITMFRFHGIRFADVACLLLFLSLAAPLHAQPAAINRVLALDGKESYVELPPNVFTNLTEATVEVWAKWDSFLMHSRIFEFGAPRQSMILFNSLRKSDLQFALNPQQDASRNPSAQNLIGVNDLLRTSEWIHVAALSGPGGMKLYANGVLVGENAANAASFADMKVSQTNFLGRGLAPGLPQNQYLHGQIDEFRVWNHRRTEEQIRESMFKQLTGAEPGLAGLWNFDNVENGVVKDSTSGAHHGKLMGNAKAIEAQLPTAIELILPRVVSGKVTDRAGNPVTNATVRVMRQERPPRTSRAQGDS